MLGLSCLAASSARAATSFAPPTDVQVGHQVSDIAVGDVNGGPDDVVAVGSQTVSILVGDGLGGLDLDGSRPVDFEPSAVALADFDADGDADLAVANQAGSSVSILVGDGTGTFVDASVEPVGSAPVGIAAGDLDGDGDPDLVVANSADDDVSVLLGEDEADGEPPAFAPAVDHPAPIAPREVVIAQLDAGPTLDVSVAPAQSGQLLLLAGDGTGALGAAAPLGDVGNASGLAASDFDADGLQDLAATDPSARVRLWLGALGDFAAPGFDAAGSERIRAADFDEDGEPDLATSGPGARVGLLRGERLGADPAAADLGLIVIGEQSASQTIELRNADSAALTLAKAELSGLHSGDFTIVSDGCGGAPLAPAGTCQLVVGFAPSEEGPREALVSVDFGAGGQKTVALSGFGSLFPPWFTLEPGTLSFGNVQQGQASAPQDVVISVDHGNGLDDVEATVQEDPLGAFEVVGDACSRQPLADGAHCSISLRFAPTAVGEHVAYLIVRSESADVAWDVPLEGVGVAAAAGPPTPRFPPTGPPRPPDVFTPPVTPTSPVPPLAKPDPSRAVRRLKAAGLDGLLRTRRLNVAFAAPSAGRATLALTTTVPRRKGARGRRTVVLAKGTRAYAAAASGRVTAKVTRSGARLLKNSGALRVRVSLTFADTVGRRASSTRVLRVPR